MSHWTQNKKFVSNVHKQYTFFFFFLFVVNFVIHWNETAMGLHVFPIPIPPPASLSTRSLQVFPVHQVQALVSCIHPGLVICFTLDSIHVSMLFSWNTMEYYSAIKKNSFESVLMRWVKHFKRIKKTFRNKK